MIIDCHVHLLLGDGELEKLLAAADELGIDRLCVSSCGEAFRQPGNEAVRQAFEKYPERLVGAGWVRLGTDAPDVVDCLADEGFLMLKVINPPVPYDHDDLLPVYERAAARGLPVLFHTGVVVGTPFDAQYDVCSDRMRPIRLDRIARRFPALKIIGAHLGTPWIDEALAMAQFHPNVYYDCTGVIRRLIDKPPHYFDTLIYWPAFTKKWLFGSDTLADGMAHVADLHHQLMHRLALPPADKEAVMGERMATLLGLTAE